jgi:hypothetical protein
MEQTVTSPTSADLERLESMRTWVRDHYAPEAHHKYESIDGKLNLLETILDSGWIRTDETLKLQCLGITFGDALAQELELEWIIVEDENGRDPALRSPGTSILLFPQTTISKRIEAGEFVAVRNLFQFACAKVHRIRKELAC